MLDGAKILRETWENNSLIPLYDNEDSVCGIIYNEVPYYFLKNQQGDVIAITDNTGKDVARYSYDAWGVCTVTYTDMELTCGIDIANINPYRYRSYYFDKEIQMYYLQSRYYDPIVGRFVNGDMPEFAKLTQNILQHNLYSYCKNNPVNEIDIAGQLAAQLIARIILGILIGLFSQLVIDLIGYWFSKAFNNSKSFSPSAGDYISSAFSWAITCVSFNNQVVELCVNLIPILIKHVYRAFTRNFDWIDLAIDCVYYLISFLIRKKLKWSEKNKIGKIKAKFGTGNKAKNKIRIATKRVNVKFNVLGIKANFGLNISSFFTSIIYNYITARV